MSGVTVPPAAELLLSGAYVSCSDACPSKRLRRMQRRCTCTEKMRGRRESFARRIPEKMEAVCNTESLLRSLRYSADPEA